jgi:hypothetical protein
VIDQNPINIGQFFQPIISFDNANSPSPIPANGGGPSSSSREYLNSTDDDDEVFDESNQIKDQSNQHQTYHSERTLLASHSSQEEKTLEGINPPEEPSKRGKMPIQSENTPMKRRPRNLRLPPLSRLQRPISSASEQPATQTPNAKVHRLLSRIDESFRQKWSRIRSKSSSMVNIPLHVSG